MMVLVIVAFILASIQLLVASYPFFKEWLEPDEHVQCLVLELGPFLQKHGWEWSFRNKTHHRTLSYHGWPIFYKGLYVGPFGLSTWYYLKYQIAYRLAKKQYDLDMLRES